ncbi:hypothetical protein IV498_17190 [Paenarthrobacter sp. Z7-10]|uniref:hypothetical protein n=1 Tax=Paenarthrobacter sp. Z7-10 TaxID=2787635 RepID=UPI0022A9CD8E|nr:hypothetical protein [Paenarthrobacter sp. Z7-10]MCZ2404860.1 hypothetical protein [Paenarthrobacter sp. Z7-10]
MEHWARHPGYGSTANANPITIDVPLSLLVDGANTIAVETHLNYHGTPDISFGPSVMDSPWGAGESRLRFYPGRTGEPFKYGSG